MQIHFLLAGVRSKLKWAENHIRLLNEQTAVYTLSDAYSIDTMYHSNPPRYEVKVVTQASRDDPPLSLVLGDALHNLRAGLDHLAWSLVLVSGKTPSADHPRTQFPIYTDRMTGVDPKKGNVRQVTINPGVTRRAETIIERAQPYNRPDDPTRHPLAILSHLSNIDKHRFLPLTQGKFGRVRITLRRKIDGLVLGHERRDQAVDHYTTVAVFDAAGLPPPDEVNVDSEFAPFVTLDTPDRLSTIELSTLVDEMSLAVRQVAEELATECFGTPMGLISDPIF